MCSYEKKRRCNVYITVYVCVVMRRREDVMFILLYCICVCSYEKKRRCNVYITVYVCVVMRRREDVMFILLYMCV